MNIKSMRNVLTTTTLAAAILMTTHGAVDAKETPSISSAQSTQVTVKTEVVTPKLTSSTYVKVLPKAASTATDLGTYNTIAKTAAALVEANKNMEKSVTFKYTGDIDEIRTSLSKTYRAELEKAGNDYVNGTISSWKLSYTSTGTISMEFKYLGTAEQEQYATEQVKKIAASLTKAGMSDFDKVRAVNDYVVTHTVYSKSAKTTPHHIYAYLKEGKAVCQAYALLTYRLLDEMGVESRYVTGDGNGVAHAWNSVKLNGEWYHLDTTWNDGSFNGMDVLGDTSYKYFLVTSDTLSKDHTWDKETFPKATSNTYSYLHDVDMGIEYNGAMYYNSVATGNLTKMDLSTKATTELLNHRAYFIAVFNDIVYFSDYSNFAYLSSYNLATKETQVLDKVKAAQLHIADYTLSYKGGGKLKTYALPLTAEQQQIKTVVDAIKIIKTTSKTYLTDIEAAYEAYEALTPALQAKVTNYDTLATAYEQTAAAKNVLNQIAALDGSSLEAVQNARAAYNALDKTSQKYVSNLKALTTFEAQLKSITTAISAIDAVDPTSTKVATQVVTARKAIDKVSKDKLALITNLNKFEPIEAQINVFNQIAKLKSSSAKYITEVTTAKNNFDALTNTKYVTNSSLLTTALEAIKPAQSVVAQIEKIDPTSMTSIESARKAYNALDKTSQKYVSNLKTLTTIENQVKNAAAAIVAIKAVDPTSTKVVAQVAAARKAIDKTGSQKSLITGLSKFEDIEKQINVFNQITKLQNTSTKYIAEVTAAKKAFDSLTDTTYVSNSDKLSTALETIKPAQNVVTQINALTEEATVAQIASARIAYSNLSKTAQKYVTNLTKLTTAEKKYAAVMKVITAINDTKTTTISATTFVSKAAAMKSAYTKLSNENKQLVINTDDYTYYVAIYEIKNAQKTRKWTNVTPETFKVIGINSVTADNFTKVTAAFNALKAGNGTATVSEITTNVAEALK